MIHCKIRKMKYRRELFIIIVEILLVMFLKYMNILQIENGFRKPTAMII